MELLRRDISMALIVQQEARYLDCEEAYEQWLWQEN